MTKLYELSESYNNLLALLDDETIPAADVLASLEQIEGEFTQKAQSIACLLRNIDGDINAFKAEEKRLQERRRALESKHDSLKGYLEGQMKATGLKKIDGIVPLSFRKCPASVEQTDESTDPAPEYWRVNEPEPDKKNILEALKAGIEVKGWRLVTDKESLKVG